MSDAGTEPGDRMEVTELSEAKAEIARLRRQGHACATVIAALMQRLDCQFATIDVEEIGSCAGDVTVTAERDLHEDLETLLVAYEPEAAR